jgi:gamma-glutamyl:cysteine ligase YbdK (ATP-grasp superfamily)
MNAYELADKLMSSLTMEYDCDEYMKQSATMLRHQADYIAQLEKGLESSIAMNKAQAERQVKELTDEEIRHIQAICHLKDVGYDNFIMRFARAILRKAQEK